MNITNYPNKVGYISGVEEWLNVHKYIIAVYYIDRMKDKNSVVILIDVEKAFDSTQQPFRINA